MKKLLLTLVLGGAALLLGRAIYLRLQQGDARGGSGGERAAAPVEVAPVERGPILRHRTISGTLEATAEFVLAPKVGGRLERLGADLADPVRRGAIVAWLDDDEYVQAVAQASADLAVARANLAEATSALEIARRGLQRVSTLQERGVASESQLDAARADELAKEAAVEVARAQVTRAEAAVETARIRLGYTKMKAEWTGGDEERVVAQRFVDEGDTVAANTPILSIVELDPIKGVVYVAERDYAMLRPGQPAELTTQAYPGVSFEGVIERIAPVFREATRQARVELRVKNPDRRLRPGMFIRATVELGRAEEALIVPFAALTSRGDVTGVFVVDEERRTVAWRPVRVGIRDGDRVQVGGEGVAGRVVTLGHQLLEDGAAITIPGDAPAGAPAE